MTLPDERYRSVLWAERFLREISSDTKKYPRVPRAVRQEARSILRHFPSQWDMMCAAADSPRIFQGRRPVEDLERWIREGERSQTLEATCPLGNIDTPPD